MESNNLRNLLDLINMYVGVYYDKYLGFSYCEYFKWSYFGYTKRLELFHSQNHKDLNVFAGKFIDVNPSGDHISKFEFYTEIAKNSIGLKTDEIDKFAELMLLRENLLKFTNRYNDLTGTQYGMPASHKEGRRTLFASDERNIKKDYGYVIDEVIFYKKLNDIDLEDEIIHLRQTLDNRLVERSIDEIDELIEDSCKILDQVFETNQNDFQEPILITSIFTFNNLINWDYQLNSWVKEFKNVNDFYPNLLLASSQTYARIDLVVNSKGKDHLRNLDGDEPRDEEYVEQSGFRGDAYELDFCIDEQLGVDAVKLIYDSDPDGGLPIIEKENKIRNKLKAG